MVDDELLLKMISWELDLICRNHHREGHAKGFKVLLAAADLVGFAGAELQEVLRALGLPDQVERLVVVLQDGPVGVVLADRRVDLKPAGSLTKSLMSSRVSSRLANSRSTSDS